MILFLDITLLLPVVVVCSSYQFYNQFQVEDFATVDEKKDHQGWHAKVQQSKVQQSTRVGFEVHNRPMCVNAKSVHVTYAIHDVDDACVPAMASIHQMR